MVDNNLSSFGGKECDKHLSTTVETYNNLHKTKEQIIAEKKAKRINPWEIPKDFY